MKGAPLRIERHPNQKHLGDDDSGGAGKYVEAVTKLIPGEVVAAYLSGKAVLQGGAPAPGIGSWLGWTVFCFVVVIGWRRWLTSDRPADVPAEWSAVIVSALSFLVWVYSFGDVFQMLEWWSRVGSALVLIGWTLGSPLLLYVLKRGLRK
jgi:hypothetical protein